MRNHRKMLSFVLLVLGILVLLAVVFGRERSVESQWESLSHQTQALWNSGQHGRAELAAIEALELAERAFGPEHPRVASSLNNLGLLYYCKGQYPEAERFYKHSLLMNVKLLGPHHPQVANTIRNIAHLYRTTNRKQAAQQLEKEPANAAMAIALREGDLATLESSVLRDPPPNGAGLMHVAVAAKRTDILQQLISRGADVNARDSQGRTPLHYDQMGMVPDDLVKVANVNGRLTFVETEATITKLLLASGANVNAQDELGQTALHLASISFHEDRIQRLIAAGADPALKTANGQTAADIFKTWWVALATPLPNADPGVHLYTYHTQLALLEGRDAEAAGEPELQGRDPITAAMMRQETQSAPQAIAPPNVKVQMILAGVDESPKAFINGRQYGVGDTLTIDKREWRITGINSAARSVTFTEITSNQDVEIFVGQRAPRRHRHYRYQ